MSQEELQQIMHDHGDYLVRLAYVYVKSWSEAEDIVQDVFVKFYTKHEQFEGKASLKTYLSKMTIHKSCDVIRSVKNRLRILQNKMVHQQNNTISAEQSTIDNIERSQLAHQVFNLPIKYREVIVFYYYHEYKISEIAELLGISENTVKTRLKRAKEKLKQELHPMYQEVSFDE